MTCPHEFWEREAAVYTEGICPLCQRDKIIEECARVADRHVLSVQNGYNTALTVAAAIRALKDKP